MGTVRLSNDTLSFITDMLRQALDTTPYFYEGVEDELYILESALLHLKDKNPLAGLTIRGPLY
jgi:hypothetical protein